MNHPQLSVTTPDGAARISVAFDRWDAFQTNRARWQWQIEHTETSENAAITTVIGSGDDLTTVAKITSDGTLAPMSDALGALLSFLGAAAESYQRTMRGSGSDNADMFPPAINEWAYQYSDELEMLRMDVEGES